MKKISIVVLILSGLFTGACYYDKFNELHPLDGYVNTCDSQLPNTYTGTVNIIVRSNCISCHNNDVNNGSVILETYSDVKSSINNGKFMGSILHESGFKSMPPGTTLRECDIQKLQQWIEAGMPE